MIDVKDKKIYPYTHAQFTLPRVFVRQVTPHAFTQCVSLLRSACPGIAGTLDGTLCHPHPSPRHPVTPSPHHPITPSPHHPIPAWSTRTAQATKSRHVISGTVRTHIYATSPPRTLVLPCMPTHAKAEKFLRIEYGRLIVVGVSGISQLSWFIEGWSSYFNIGATTVRPKFGGKIGRHAF